MGFSLICINLHCLKYLKQKNLPYNPNPCHKVDSHVQQSTCAIPVQCIMALEHAQETQTQLKKYKCNFQYWNIATERYRIAHLKRIDATKK